MFRAFLLLLMVAALSGCGGGDPVSACKDATNALCDKSFQCFPTESQHIYGSLSDCKTLVSNQSCTLALTTCPGGRSFSSGNASQCVDGYRNESCDDLLNGSHPAICNQTCI